jgi:hypothetical protein
MAHEGVVDTEVEEKGYSISTRVTSVENSTRILFIPYMKFNVFALSLLPVQFIPVVQVLSTDALRPAIIAIGATLKINTTSNPMNNTHSFVNCLIMSQYDNKFTLLPDVITTVQRTECAMVAGSVNSNSIGGSANNSLSVVSCRHFHENISLQEHF